MTYCVATNLSEGMIFASDSRTNAGVDNIAKFCKCRILEKAGERVIVTLSSGNLAISQGTINLLLQRGRDNHQKNVWNCNSMYEMATLIGDCLRDIQERDGAYLKQRNIDATANFIVGGQIKGENPRLFLVYSEGNFIEASEDTLFFQIGETKYGKPILDRVLTPSTTLPVAAKSIIVSFDSTMRSNISVGPPIDLIVIEKNSFKVSVHKRLEEGDPYLSLVHRQWGEGLKKAFAELADMPWESNSGSVHPLIQTPESGPS
ncbi:MAG: peptidase [Betaproteobacteria bacterium]|nr:peptidase [Betaproteobacteria bacterium]